MLIFQGRNRVTSGFQLPDRPDHNGLDIVGDDSHDILCPVAGTVKSSTIITDKSNTTWEWGNYVRVDDAEGNRLYFCHMDSRAVKVGQTVKPGDKLGVMGNTGYSFGAHTHFEVRKADNKTRLNPAEYLGIPNAKGTYTDGKTGWEKVLGLWYYYQNGQELKRQWVKDGKWWYYLGADGAMLTGYQKIGEETFWLNDKSAGENAAGIPLGACVITNDRGNILR